ncbi:hypothetical protein L209DRAFT_180482 [Thermothelomyces heterothallicus CBS 203.75]
MLPAPSSSLVIRPIHDSSSRLPVLLGGASTCDSKGRLLQRLPSRLGLQLLSYSSILLPTRYIHTTLQSDSRCRPTLDKPPPSPLRQHIRPPVCSTVTHQRYQRWSLTLDLPASRRVPRLYLSTLGSPSLWPRLWKQPHTYLRICPTVALWTTYPQLLRAATTYLGFTSSAPFHVP